MAVKKQTVRKQAFLGGVAKDAGATAVKGVADIVAAVLSRVDRLQGKRIRITTIIELEDKL